MQMYNKYSNKANRLNQPTIKQEKKKTPDFHKPGVQMYSINLKKYTMVT